MNNLKQSLDRQIKCVDSRKGSRKSRERQAAKIIEEQLILMEEHIRLPFIAERVKTIRDAIDNIIN